MISGFKIRVNGGGYVDFEHEVSLVYEHEITELVGGVEYAFQIASYNEDGDLSQWSAPVYGTPVAPSMLISGGGSAFISDAGEGILIYP